MNKKFQIVCIIAAFFFGGLVMGYGITNWAWKKRQLDCFEEGRKFEREELRNAKVYLWDDAVKIQIGGEVIEMKNFKWVGWPEERR